MAAQAGGESSGGTGGDSYRWQSTCIAEAGGGGAQVAPAAENNKEPILGVLRRYLPETGAVLEVASGTGQHVAHLARGMPGISWQPSDLTPDLFPSIAAHTDGLANVKRPVVLDATWPPERWAAALGPAPPGGCDGVQVANMTHISPWGATEGLVAGAAALLRRGGLLTIYGPFKLRGEFTTDSNRAFHERLVSSNPEWGYRDTDDVEALAARHGLSLVAVEPMPANNFFLVFRAQPGA